MITKKPIKRKLIKNMTNDLYEGALWRLMIGLKEFIVLGIYHPPQQTGMKCIIY